MLIPKTVHRIWLGPHRMPAIYQQYGESWADHGWQVITWTDHNLPDIINRDVWDAIAGGVNTGGGIAELGVWVQRADMLQWELLLQFGGVYANCDIELLRPLDDLLADVDCFAAREDNEYVGSAIVGAVAGHRTIAALVDELPRRYWRLAGRPMNEQTGPHLLTEIVGHGWPITVFPRKWFYPWHYSQLDREHAPHPDAYTNHHWGHTKPGLVEGVST